MTRKVRESELEAMRKRAEAAEAHCERLREAITKRGRKEGWHDEHPLYLALNEYSHQRRGH